MKTGVDIEIIKRVQSKRIEQGDSLRAISRIIGTSHSFPREVEDMKKPCKYSADQLYYIARHFECPVSDFFPSLAAFPPKLEMPKG